MSAVRVVVAGGGVAALEGTLALRALARDPISIEVVAPESEFVYRPLAVTEPFHAGRAQRFPLGRLVAAAGGRLRPGRISTVDPDRRVAITSEGAELAYDALLLAPGARQREAIPGAVTFYGPESSVGVLLDLEQALLGRLRRVVFVVPGGVTWPLPLYELALLTKTFLADRGAVNVEVVLVTPEERPLTVFGQQASDAVAELLVRREIDCRCGTTAVRFEDGVLQTAPSGAMDADRVVALPHLEGPRLVGLPCDAEGFIPVDPYCRVLSEPDVYAAGDATHFPIKQGGIAAQQADVAATDIALRAGSTVEPTPFKPVLRGLLLTGTVPRFLHAEPGTARSLISTEALWWPPAKIVGHHLSPFLASNLDLSHETASISARL